ncbi:lipopolysaccharide biosynthesis protein [Kitasatospora sp. LaBMicrA B282]|uniref:lipopolysaccharide biosynthesis protein n=1 Tax=Kitasatospora sp. LaBMicrA B282 TaxID=3420949 RepID=UPI003D14ED87
MNPIAKLLKALPPGTQLVAGGTVVLGAASYLHLAAAGHSLSKSDMAGVSVLWTLVMSVGIGLFFPIEQELTRIVAARVVRGDGAAPVLRRTALLTVGILVVVLGLLAAFARPIADRLFHGDLQLVAALGGAFVGMALCYVTRGILAGTGRFKAYGAQLGIDGTLRIVLAFGCSFAGLHSALAFSLILSVAPLVALAVTLPATLRAAEPGGAFRLRELVGGLGLLIVSTLLAQVVVNAAVMSTQLLAPARTDLIAALLSALVLARVPLFVFGSLQASLLSGLSSAVAAGDHQGFMRMLRKTCLVVAGLGAVGGVPAVLLGPWLIEILFGATPGQLGHLDFLWFSIGTTCYMLAMVLGQAQMVLHKHLVQLASWGFGTAVLLGVTLLPGDITVRVGLAYAVGSALTAAAMLVSLWRAVPRAPRGTQGAPEVAAATDDRTVSAQSHS